MAVRMERCPNCKRLAPLIPGWAVNHINHHRRCARCWIREAKQPTPKGVVEK